MKALWICSLGTLFISTAVQAAADPDRYVIFIDAEAEAAPSPALIIESALGEHVRAQGGTVIDDAQSRKIRNFTRVQDLVTEQAAEVITSLDADIVVTARFQCSQAPPAKMLKDRTKRYVCSGLLKTLAVDSAEVLGTYTAERSGYGFTKAEAVRAAARAVANVLKEGIGSSEKKRRIELTVRGVSDVQRLQVFRQAVEQISGVKRVVVDHVDLPVAELTISMSNAGATPEALALSMDGLGGVTVIAYSDRAVQVELRGEVIHSAPMANGVQMVTNISEIFPARLGHYAVSPVGEIKLTNPTAAKIKNLTATAFLRGYGRKPFSFVIEQIKPGSTVVQALSIQLDARALRKRVGDDTATLEIHWKSGAAAGTEKKTVRVFDRRAMDWRVPESVAAFVISSKRVVALAQRIKQVIGQDQAEPVAITAGIVTSLTNLQYAIDPLHPGRSDLDEVQWPDETLARGQGDCDDGSVLVAAIAQAAGLKAAFILTPGHVLVGLDSGRPPQGWHDVSADKNDLLVSGHRAWLPVETTVLKQGFLKAWNEGARRIQRAQAHGASVTVIEVDAAQKKYPAIDLAEPTDATNRAIASDWTQTVGDAVEAWRKQYREAWRNTLQTESNDEMRALALVKLGRTQEAIATRATAPRTPNNLNELGNLHLLSGQPQIALQHYLEALNAGAKLPTRMNAILAARLANDARAVVRLMKEVYTPQGLPTRMQAFLKAMESQAQGPRGARTPLPRAMETFLFWGED